MLPWINKIPEDPKGVIKDFKKAKISFCSFPDNTDET